MNSRAKGQRGERELADFLARHGLPARRGQQFAGSPWSPDVVCPGLPFHIEVKRTERLNLDAACAQAERDAGGAQAVGRLPPPQQKPVARHARRRRVPRQHFADIGKMLPARSLHPARERKRHHGAARGQRRRTL